MMLMIFNLFNVFKFVHLALVSLFAYIQAEVMPFILLLFYLISYIKLIGWVVLGYFKDRGEPLDVSPLCI